MAGKAIGHAKIDDHERLVASQPVGEMAHGRRLGQGIDLEIAPSDQRGNQGGPHADGGSAQRFQAFLRQSGGPLQRPLPDTSRFVPGWPAIQPQGRQQHVQIAAVDQVGALLHGVQPPHAASEQAGLQRRILRRCSRLNVAIGCQALDFGEQVRQQPHLVHQNEAVRRAGRLEELLQFHGNPFRRHGADGGGVRRHRRARFRLDVQPEAAGELNAAQHAQGVLGKGQRADLTQHTGFQVGVPAERVDEAFVKQVERHGVDGEIAARQVGFNGQGVIEGHLEIPVADAGGGFNAGQGDVDGRAVPVARLKLEHPERLPDALHPPAPPQQAHQVGLGQPRNQQIKVFVRLAQQDVPQRAAHHVDAPAGFTDGVYERHNGGVQVHGCGGSPVRGIQARFEDTSVTPANRLPSNRSPWLFSMVRIDSG